MTLHGLSDAFLEAVRTSHKVARSVVVRDSSGNFLADITESIVEGGGSTVSVDETQEIRRTLNLALMGTEDLIPADLNDLLHPASCNEVWVERGVEYPDGSTELAPLGVFRTTKPVASDDGSTVDLRVGGKDRASVIAGVDWLAPYAIPTGNNPGAALQIAMNSRMAGLEYNFANVTFTYPATIFGADPSQAGDPMSDFITFAAAPACELFFDPLGVPTFRPVVNPLTSVVVDALTFVEGEDGTMVSAARTLDADATRNGVVLYCNGPGLAQPFKVEVWDTNPASPTYYLGKWGKRPYKMITTAIPAGTDTLPVAKIKATRMAFGQLQLILGAFDNTSASCVPNPALREGDCLQVTRSRLKIDDPYVLSAFTVPLDVAGTMTVSYRPRISAL